MAGEIENLPRASFAGIEFPVESYRVVGSVRHHVHTYARVPGGDIEKLGRNLYEVEMRCCFLTSSVKYQGGPAGALWPNRLATLRSIFESEETSELVIPTIGSIEAECLTWDQEFVGRILNGEKTTFKFLEDQSAAFLLKGLINVESKSLGTATDKLEVTLEQALKDQSPSQADQDLFDTIISTAHSILAIADQIELQGVLIQEKLGALAGLCYEADHAVQMFNDPENYYLLEALKDLWAAANGLAESIAGPTTNFSYYETVQQMTIAQVATAIYGSSERATELLQLNPINDAFAIPPRTRIRYIADTTSLRAA